MTQRNTTAEFRSASTSLVGGLLRVDIALVALVLVLLITTGGAG